MKKKIIALTLIFAMLVPFVPAAAAEETAARPTVEEILSQYHQAAFEAEMNGEESAAYSPRSGSNEPTLEQQTVDTLNEAGYEAYNVTADNYDTLEEQLQTDFADMGLDPEGSYIVVIHGEEEQSPNGNARLGDPLRPPHLWEPGDGPSGDGTFVHTYNGTNYMMRYLTVTKASNSQLDQEFIQVIPRSHLSINWDNVDEAILYYITDEATGPVPIGSVLSLLSDAFADENYIKVDGDSIIVHGRSVWTLQYIQVYNNASETWFSSQCSEYVSAAAWCIGSTCSDSGDITLHAGNETHFKDYSPEYNNTSLRRDYAAIGFTSGMLIADRTEEIDFLLMNEDKDLNYCGDIDEILFTQPHWLDLAP